MVNGININLFDFQEKAVIKLLDIVTDSRSKQTVIVKSPTGSGKTIILIDFIEEYLTKINSRTAFIWLCPGKGDLEEQSRQKMRKFAPHRYTQNLFDALQNGFDTESTTFINWELVTPPSGTANGRTFLTALRKPTGQERNSSSSSTRNIPITPQRQRQL